MVNSDTLVTSRAANPTWTEGGKPHLDRGANTVNGDTLLTSRMAKPTWGGNTVGKTDQQFKFRGVGDTLSHNVTRTVCVCQALDPKWHVDVSQEDLQEIEKQTT